MYSHQHLLHEFESFLLYILALEECLGHVLHVLGVILIDLVQTSPVSLTTFLLLLPAFINFLVELFLLKHTELHGLHIVTT